MKKITGIILVLLILSLWTVTGHCDTEIQAINAAGNLNRPLSIDPIKNREGYSTVLYDNKNGLPTSEANAIAQTGDGFLWIGSYSGLIRYDGTSFERMDSTTGISNVRTLYVDKRDRLWIGTNDSGLFLMTRGEIHNWNKKDGLESVSIREVIEEDGGTIYIGTTAGISMMGRDMTLTPMKDERISGQIIREFRHGSDGLIYGLTQNGDIFTLSEGRIQTFLSHEECRVEGVVSIFPDPVHPGDLYVGASDSIVYYGSLEKNFASMGMKDISPLTNPESFEYLNGELWLCAGNGIGKLSTDGFHRLVNVPMNSSIGNILTDYEGNLWFTSTRQGVMKIVPNRFSDLSARYDLPTSVVNTTCMYEDQLFIGTDTGLVVVEDRKRLQKLPLTRAETASGVPLGATDLLTFLDGVRIRSIVCDSKGRLWISTWRSSGLLCYENGEITAFTPDEGLFSDKIRAVCECEDGSVLVANTGGVSIIKGGRLADSYGIDDGISVDEILTVAEGFHKEIILGSDGGGIYIIQDGKTRHIGLEDGLSSEVILRIKRSRFQDVYWIVTSNSLAYMTPDFEVVTISRFPYPNNYDLVENSKGDVWVLSSNGIYVIPAEKLLENSEVDPVFYGIRNGLPYMTTANSYNCMTEDGSLYISGTAGVMLVNIEKPMNEVSELKISLPFIDADGKRYYPASEGAFSLPGSARKITIYPYVFNYSLTDPQVSYRLDGFDHSDTTISRSRLVPVNYTNLRNGTFQFVMTVKDSTGLSEQTVSFPIIKGKMMSPGSAGTIIMILASLLLMSGTLLYTAPYRKQTQLKDRLLFGLMIVNLFLALGDLLANALEYVVLPLSRELMILGNTTFFFCLVLFPYLLLLYLIVVSGKYSSLSGKTKLLYGIPCILTAVGLIINLKNGWIFYIGSDYVYHSSLNGIWGYIPDLPAMLYFALSVIKVYRISRPNAMSGFLLLCARLLLELWCPDISCTSFFYTMILVSIHLYLMNRPFDEVAS